MRYPSILFILAIALMIHPVPTHGDSIKTGVIKAEPSANQISVSPKATPTPAPGINPETIKPAPVQPKQIGTFPLTQKGTIPVKSPIQGARHTPKTPLVITWDKSPIAAYATVNIFLVDKPEGTVRTTIKTGAPNSGSFTSWVPPGNLAAPGTSWVVRIETADKKLLGHSGAFTLGAAALPKTTGFPSVKQPLGGASSGHEGISTQGRSALQLEQGLPVTQSIPKDFPLSPETGRRIVTLNISNNLPTSQLAGKRSITMDISADSMKSTQVGRRVLSMDISANPTSANPAGQPKIILDNPAF
jgi:hypothetical protein